MVRNSPVAHRERQVLDHPGRRLAALALREALAELADFEQRRLATITVSIDRLDRRPPAQQQRFERVHQPVGGMHQQRRRHDRGEHAGGVEVHRAGLHQIAEPAVRRDQLGDHGGADRVGHRDAEAGEDVGHRARHHDVARDLPFARAHDLRHLHQLGVERAHARERREIDDEEHHARDQRDLRFDADAEPQDEQRREGELGRAVAADHERIEDRDDDRMPAQQERQQHRRHAADQRAGDGLAERVAGVPDQFAVEDLLDKARRRRPGRADSQ